MKWTKENNISANEVIVVLIAEKKNDIHRKQVFQKY